MKRTLIVSLLVAGAAACSSPEREVTIRDSRGNYITTSQFNALSRVDFVRAIQDGLTDYDMQVTDLRTRANELGGDALEEFAECELHLRDKRETVVNELEIAKSALDSQYPEARKDTTSAYLDLREAFSEAQEDVFDA